LIFFSTENTIIEHTHAMNKISGKLKHIPLFIIYLLIISCSKNSSTEPKVDMQKLATAFSNAQQIGNLKSLVVVHNDSILKESFYGTGGADVAHDVRSVTKCVTGILIGIAIDMGFLRSVDQTVGEFIDTLAFNITPDKSAIKIRHLLTMTSGFEWDEMTSVTGYNNWILSDNQVQYLFDKPLIHKSGEYFTYNTAALHLLSVIITKATGMSTKAFALKYLFEPMGITEIEWQMDNQGFNNGGAGLKITPHDMVKIGRLILNRGVYNGKVIVSSNYLDKCGSPQITTNNTIPYGTDYGYCWWIGQNNKYIFANGYGGQFIVIVPSSKLVVIATNQWSGVGAQVANDQWYKTLSLIMNEIIPVFE